MKPSNVIKFWGKFFCDSCFATHRKFDFKFYSYLAKAFLMSYRFWMFFIVSLSAFNSSGFWNNSAASWFFSLKSAVRSSKSSISSPVQVSSSRITFLVSSRFTRAYSTSCFWRFISTLCFFSWTSAITLSFSPSAIASSKAYTRLSWNWATSALSFCPRFRYYSNFCAFYKSACILSCSYLYFCALWAAISTLAFRLTCLKSTLNSLCFFSILRLGWVYLYGYLLATDWHSSSRTSVHSKIARASESGLAIT